MKLSMLFFTLIILLLSLSEVDCNTAIIGKQWNTLWTTTKKKASQSKLQVDSFIPASDISSPDRRIWIVTTACLPWMTGTSINPLLRAAYLANERPEGKITLLVPWVNKDDQDILFPAGIRFHHPEEQRKYVKEWLIRTAHLPIAAERLQIIFYYGRFHDEFHSIFPMGDITDLIPDDEADVCVLEEPEHLNWYRAPFTAKAWKDKFRHVIGVMHTNYLMYSRQHPGGFFKEPVLFVINQAMARSYCHKIIKLSGALQEFAPEIEEISNVHGVRQQFLQAGDAAAVTGFTKGAYFVGKMAWQKGLDELFRLMKHTETNSQSSFNIDIYGHGPHENEIKQRAVKEKLKVHFFGPKDHSHLTEYRVFVNPSVSEVLCTTVAEALAMGKWVICPYHPSNAFFEQFPNCLTYRNNKEFAANVFWALHHDPTPLSASLRRELSWDAATERFVRASRLSVHMHHKSLAKSFVEKIQRSIHTFIGSGSHGDTVRFLAGGKSVSKQIEYMGMHGTADPMKLHDKLQEERLPDQHEEQDEPAPVFDQNGSSSITSSDSSHHVDKEIINTEKKIETASHTEIENKEILSDRAVLKAMSGKTDNTPIETTNQKSETTETAETAVDNITQKKNELKKVIEENQEEVKEKKEEEKKEEVEVKKDEEKKEEVKEEKEEEKKEEVKVKKEEEKKEKVEVKKEEEKKEEVEEKKGEEKKEEVEVKKEEEKKEEVEEKKEEEKKEEAKEKKEEEKEGEVEVKKEEEKKEEVKVKNEEEKKEEKKGEEKKEEAVIEKKEEKKDVEDHLEVTEREAEEKIKSEGNSDNQAVTCAVQVDDVADSSLSCKSDVTKKSNEEVKTEKHTSLEASVDITLGTGTGG